MPGVVIKVSILPESGDGMADSYFPITNFNGQSSTTIDFIQLGVNDGDTMRTLIHSTDITDTQLRSIHSDDDSTSYQNGSGFNAIAVLVLGARGAATVIRNFKLWSSPNDNSKTSATLVYDFSTSTVGTVFDSSADSFTCPPVKVQNSHYLVLENLSGSATGDIDVGLGSKVVERTV